MVEWGFKPLGEDRLDFGVGGREPAVRPGRDAPKIQWGKEAGEARGKIGFYDSTEFFLRGRFRMAGYVVPPGKDDLYLENLRLVLYRAYPLKECTGVVPLGVTLGRVSQARAIQEADEMVSAGKRTQVVAKLPRRDGCRKCFSSEVANQEVKFVVPVVLRVDSEMEEGVVLSAPSARRIRASGAARDGGQPARTLKTAQRQ